MGKNQRKILRNYILEGGVKGKYFHSSDGGNPGIYAIEEVMEQNFDGIVRLGIFFIGCFDMFSLPLAEHLHDREATSKEVREIKEGQLAQKTRRKPIPEPDHKEYGLQMQERDAERRHRLAQAAASRGEHTPG